MTARLPWRRVTTPSRPRGGRPRPRRRPARLRRLERASREARPELLPLLLVLLLGGALPATASRRLRARGDRWSPGRTAVVRGAAGSAPSSSPRCAGLAAYDTSLFAPHMVQHMLLTMVAPVFLALGAPVTLALRTLPAGPRGGCCALLHSRRRGAADLPARRRGLLFVASPFALYFSGWYEATLDSRLLHELLHVHFLAVGCAVLLAAARRRPGAGPPRLPVPDAARGARRCPSTPSSASRS